ncbi:MULTISPECIES: response regulator [unclassified Butyrivibrio]|uniref:response regulator n=1 Tax=unclassified Butyrivibrio TaxID=2639466 RepID=UPI0003FBEBA7|nr:MULTISPECIES: response regulator [unclassified Butyrivibrio]SEL74690.1 Response regulator receiver domain-containing protein [Butyrivibrio sp. ob235]
MSKIEKSVVFLMEKSSIVISGLEKKIKAERFETISIVEDFDKIDNCVRDAAVFVVYNPQDILDVKNGKKNMILIKDQVKDHDCNMIFIAEAGDKEKMLREFPELVSYRWMIRPVEPEAFVLAVEEEMTDYMKRLDKKVKEQQAAEERAQNGESEEAVLGDDRDAVMMLNEAEQDVRKKILIVDDDPSYAGMVKSWIKDKYKTDVVTAGMQAITFLLKKPVDLILLDYEMPVVDGPQVLQMLRQEPATKDIPVVFLTGVSSREGVKRVMELKPSGYILKSTTSENLLAILEEKLRS